MYAPEMPRAAAPATRGTGIPLMPVTLKKKSIDMLLDELGKLSSEPARRKFLAQHKNLIRQKTIEQLAQLVVQRVRVSTQEAFHLADRKSTRLNSSHT